MSDDTPSYVAQCARAIGTKAQCWYRPARVTAVTVQHRGWHDLTVWVVTEVGDRQLSYRFFLRRLPQYEKPIISTEAIARLVAGSVYPCPFLEVPGNVRDLAVTVAVRAFGFPEIDLFK